MSSNIFKDSEDFETNRKRQIDTLKVFNFNVQEVQPGLEYQVEFWAGEKRMVLLVQLSSEFPLEKPTLIVSPIVNHVWVDHCGRITSAPGLVNFTQHSDLGRVVHAIIREFELRPPVWIGPENSAGAASENDSPVDNTKQPSPVPIVQSPDKSQIQQMAFPELAGMSNEELQLLLNNDDRLLEYVQNLPASKQIEDSLDNLMLTTEALARSNLSQQTELEEARAACEELRKELSKHYESYETLNMQFQSLADRRTPASIRESLRAATLKSDEESEHIAEQFLSGELGVDNFLVNYINKRMMSYFRRIKEEKLSQQLRDLVRAGY